MIRRLRPRLPLASFERWLASPEAQACVHRRGRPGSGERPLVAEAARRFQVDRRTIERALSRLARRRRLLAEHQSVDAATAALLLGAAKSFVHAENTTKTAGQMRQAPGLGSQVASVQALNPPPPTREALRAAVQELVAAGVLRQEDLILPVISHEYRDATAAQLAAVGLRTPVQPETGRTDDPLVLSKSALLDALDAVQAQLPSNHPVQTQASNLRAALDLL